MGIWPGPNRTYSASLTALAPTLDVNFMADSESSGLGRPASVGWVTGDTTVDVTIYNDRGYPGETIRQDLSVQAIDLGAFGPVGRVVVTRVAADAAVQVVGGEPCALA